MSYHWWMLTLKHLLAKYTAAAESSSHLSKGGHAEQFARELLGWRTFHINSWIGGKSLHADGYCRGQRFVWDDQQPSQNTVVTKIIWDQNWTKGSNLSFCTLNRILVFYFAWRLISMFFDCLRSLYHPINSSGETIYSYVFVGKWQHDLAKIAVFIAPD